MKPKIIFFGNSGSKFSTGLFKHFLDAECNLVAVVDTPVKDRQTTSGSIDSLADFVSIAKEHGIPGFAPDSPNADEFLNTLKAYEPDAIVLAGYTRLIKNDLRQISKVASINFHASLLPEYRGRHPVFWAIRNGETETGITAHHLSDKLDEGNIAFQKAVPIAEYDSVEQVYDKVIAVSKDVVIELCQALKNGKVPDIKQRAGGAYYSYIKPEDWIIHSSMSAKQIKNMVRATPGKCWFYHGDEKVFVSEAKETETALLNLTTVDGKDYFLKVAINKKRFLDMYERMVLIRKYEEHIYYLFLEGTMPGSIHQSHGQEACAVGTLFDLRADDYVGSTHRPAGHCLAKGVSLQSMMCEMFAKRNGCCGAKGGAMHTGDISVGMLPANAIVAGNMPIMCGVALSFKLRKTDRIAISFFGDGATNEGAFHESLNAAAIWKLPLIFVCENNLYGASTPIRTTCLLENPAADRGSAYGIPGVVVDGNDVLAVNQAMTDAVKRARSGLGPTILELKTYRIGGHSRNDACAYRSKEEEAEWFARDPIKNFGDYLVQSDFCTQNELEVIQRRIESEVEEAAEFAKNSPDPNPRDALTNVYWEKGGV